MKVMIVGCGRVGWRLASDFTDRGHEVSVIDIRPSSFRRLPENFPGKTILGTGIDEDVLRSGNIQDADVFIAVTEEDNTNIMSAQIARNIFHVDRVILRIYDPVRAEIYRGLGLTVVCPTTTVAGLIEEEVLFANGSESHARSRS
ncbi:MAG TPA: TrkA family potassium uptake protein [Thermomicrobiaceae bacterium]|nr:TrkA family potassium uptake protein [Thermomicrobiaceae bacterium]